MLQIILISWRQGLRSRYFLGVAIFALLLVFAAYLSASFSPRAPRTVALDVGLSGMRVSLILLGLLWIQESVAREINQRTVLIALSYPINRGFYFAGRVVGVLILGLVAAVCLGFALIIAIVAAGLGYEAQEYMPSLGLPFWAAVVGLWLESVVVISFASAVAAMATTPTLPFVLGLGFAIGSRSLGAAIEYVASGADKSLSSSNLSILNAIHWILPDMERLDWRFWPMYQMAPTPDAVIFSVLSAIAYSALMLTIALAVFSRREFA